MIQSISRPAPFLKGISISVLLSGLFCLVFLNFSYGDEGLMPSPDMEVEDAPALSTVLGSEEIVPESSGDDTSVVLSPRDFYGMLDLSNGQEAWLDGRTIRYLLASFKDQSSSPLVELLDRLLRVGISRDNRRFYVTIEYPDELTIQVRPFTQTGNWQLYGLKVPRISKFWLEVQNGAVELREVPLQDGSEPWRIIVNLPFLPDTIYIRKASLDLVNGHISIGAGFFDDLIGVVAEAKVAESDVSYMGISFWQSLLESLRITRWFSQD